MQLPSVDCKSMRQRGSAMIEFILLGIVLLVPLSLGMTDLSNYFNALMAGESAAREAVRGYALASSSQVGTRNAEAISLLVLKDSGVRYHDLTLKVRCSSNPCLTPGGTISAVIDFRIELRTISPAIHVVEIEPVNLWSMSR